METTGTQIIKAVSHIWEVDYKTIIKNTRESTSLEPRQVCMYLMYKFLGLSYYRVGIVMKRDNGKAFDHASVLHAVRSVDRLLETDKHYNGRYLAVLDILVTGIYPAAYPVLDIEELTNSDQPDSSVVKNIHSLNKILGMIQSSRGLIDELLNDPEDKYLPEIEKIKSETVSLSSHLGIRIAGINQKLWHSHKTPDHDKGEAA